MSSTHWPAYKLDELGYVGRGKSRHRPRNDARLYGGEYPFIQTADVMAADPYITSFSQTYSDFGLRQSKLWQPNIMCMTIAGANTAKTAILNFAACFPDSVVGFVPDSNKADLHFVKYSLDLLKENFLAVSRGATQDNLSLDKLLSFEIPVPDLSTQQKLSSIVSSYDKLLEINNRRISTIYSLAKLFFEDWKHEIKNQDSIVIGELDSIGSLIKTPFSPANDSELPLLDLSRMPQNSLSPVAWAKASDLSTSRIIFDRDDILFGSIRPYLHKVVLSPQKGITNTSVFVIRPTDCMYWCLLVMALSDVETIRWANQHSTGTKMPVIKWSLLRKMPVVLTSDNKMYEKLNETLSPLLRLIETLSLANSNLREQRKRILPLAIRGELGI